MAAIIVLIIVLALIFKGLQLMRKHITRGHQKHGERRSSKRATGGFRPMAGGVFLGHNHGKSSTPPPRAVGDRQAGGLRSLGKPSQPAVDWVTGKRLRP